MRKGVYALIITNGKEQYIQIGKLGSFLFLNGFYVYIGSALGNYSTSLESRLKRHLSPTKKMFWHIDFLLNSRNIEITTIIFAYTSERKECALAASVDQLEVVQARNWEIPVRRFGASDCTCPSHLFYFPVEEPKLIALIESAFSKINLKPHLCPKNLTFQ